MRRTNWRALFICIAIGLASAPAAAITIRVDYTYDSSNFFGNNAQAKGALQAAAGFFSNILNDSFSEITVPQPFTLGGSNYKWDWSRDFPHPSSTGTVTLNHTTAGTIIAANEYVIFAGAQNLPENTLGKGGPGGYSWSHGGSYNTAYESQINAITSTFESQVVRRGQSSGFARWGGTISFDSAPPAPWHYSHTTAPSGNVIDFYSVAIHEMGHALGLGTSTDWQSWVSGLQFFGSNAVNNNGGSPVPLYNSGHWADGTMSTIYGGAAAQETAMDPSLTNGTRKYFTELDAAAMTDIGWSVIPLPGVHGDYNNDGIVNAADYVIWRKRLGQNVTIPNDASPGSVTVSDYTVWRNNFGRIPLGGAGSAALAVTAPEPTSAALALLAILSFCATRRPSSR